MNEPTQLQELIDLPDGYTAMPDSCVGYSYLDENGSYVAQAPRDTNSVRLMVWEGYKRRMATAKKGRK